MITLALWAVILGGSYVLLEVGCREKRPPAGMSWFDVYPNLPVSKKKRGRGEVNHDGLSRREQRRGKFTPK